MNRRLLSMEKKDVGRRRKSHSQKANWIWALACLGEGQPISQGRNVDQIYLYSPKEVTPHPGDKSESLCSRPGTQSYSAISLTRKLLGDI